MGADYYVAVHQGDWPSVARLNECLSDLEYPVRLVVPPTSQANMPLRDAHGSLKLTYAGEPIELEGSIVQLSATDSFAYGLELEDGKGRPSTDISDFVPLDLNSELKKLGMEAPKFEYGDFVLTLTFRTHVTEWKAGFFLMSGLIRCSNGLGFEYSEASYGGASFADKLVREALDME